MLHPNCYMLGWLLILLGFLSGAILGLGFHGDDFLGGYNSFRRRLLRLGHIALVALGALNVLASVTVPVRAYSSIACALLIGGAISMPGVCFLSAWKTSFRHLFFIPVLCLAGGVVLILLGGAP